MKVVSPIVKDVVRAVMPVVWDEELGEEYVEYEIDGIGAVFYIKRRRDGEKHESGATVDNPFRR